MFGQKHLKEEFTISNPTEQPTDTISSISWSKTTILPTLAAGSWDSHVRIYQANPEESSLKQTAIFDAKTPCLGVDWHEDGIQVFAGCASGDVKGFDSTNLKGFDVGRHTKPVKDVHWVTGINVLCSVSFDKTIKLWDLRQREPVYQCELRYKPFSSDVHGHQLALALSDSKVVLIDLAEALKTQSSQEGLQYMDSPLEKIDPLSCIRFLPGGERLALGTAGGKANVSRLERIGLQMTQLFNVMTWRAHRVHALLGNTSTQRTTIYPVNSIFGNSKRPDGFVGTCGGEGKIYYWDCESGNQCGEYQMRDPVTCGKMNWDGSLLAFATGNDWSRGITEYKANKYSEVYIRRVREEELVWKARKSVNKEKREKVSFRK